MTFRPKSEFLDVMLSRGFVQDCTDLEGLDAALAAGEVPGYIGFDATASSLHVGSLIQIMMLRWLQRTGHRPIVLMGGGTSKIGDPSLRAEERALLGDAEIAANIAGIRRVFDKYVDFGDGGALMLDNAEWLDGLNYIAFLREIGRHFSVNRMLSFESVKTRLDREQSLSFLEFNYMILQAYDFLELQRRFGCRLQMGGSDQWGNIVSGIDLARRVDGAKVFGLTSPLLTTADGRKMGKTAGGAVWLNEDMLHPFDFWQFWRNTADADVGRFLKLYTELPVEECERLGTLSGGEINAAKIVLAREVTTLCHGPEKAAEAEAAARGIFSDTAVAGGRVEAEAAARGIISDTAVAGDRVEASVVRAAGSGGLPTLELAPSDIPTGGIPIVQLLVRTGLAASGKDARRLIAEGGARLDDQPVTDPGRTLDAAALAGTPKLSAGRKRHALVRLDT